MWACGRLLDSRERPGRRFKPWWRSGEWKRWAADMGERPDDRPKKLRTPGWNPAGQKVIVSSREGGQTSTVAVLWGKWDEVNLGHFEFPTWVSNPRGSAQQQLAVKIRAQERIWGKTTTCLSPQTMLISHFLLSFPKVVIPARANPMPVFPRSPPWTSMDRTKVINLGVGCTVQSLASHCQFTSRKRNSTRVKFVLFQYLNKNRPWWRSSKIKAFSFTGASSLNKIFLLLYFSYT